MAIERNDNMVDITERPVHIGDVIYIPSSYGADADMYIIKHFSNNGIFGWRLSPWYWQSDSIKDRVQGAIQEDHFRCSSRYFQYAWSSKNGFPSSIIKVNVEDLPISQAQYQIILRGIGVKKDEFELTGSIRL
jgi:hypothetical protein